MAWRINGIVEYEKTQRSEEDAAGITRSDNVNMWDRFEDKCNDIHWQGEGRTTIETDD